MRGRLGELDELHEIIQRAIEEGASKSLTTTASSSLSVTSLKGSTTSSARAAVAGSVVAPWSREDDRALMGRIAELGLRWGPVAESIEGRTSGQCKERWEQLLNEQLGSEGCRTVSSMLLAARKSGRDAEALMNQVAGQLTRAKSDLQRVSVVAQKAAAKAAVRRGWLRDHTHVQLTGEGEEHDRLRAYLKVVGPTQLLARAHASARRAEASQKELSLAAELGLKRLVIEVGTAPAVAESKGEDFLRICDTESGAICLYWEPARDGRVTDPSSSQHLDSLTKKLHEA